VRVLWISVFVFAVSPGFGFGRYRLVLLECGKPTGSALIDRSVTLPPTAGDRQNYREVRQKTDHFFSDSGERSMTLSSGELNALISESPELRILNRGTVVTLNQNTAELYCSLPVNLPFLSRRYFNYTIFIRPSMRGENIELEVFRMEREGRPLGPKELRQFQIVAVPLIEKILSSWNKLQIDRSVRDVRIENGNLILAR
jgi:hypothetical protein